MANDIIARLRLSGQQFTADTKSTFSNFNREAVSSATQAKSAFETNFAAIQDTVRRALTAPRAANGALDLGAAGMRATAEAAEVEARAYRDVAEAAERLAKSTGDASRETHLYVQAARAVATQAESSALDLAQEVVVLERLQSELAQASGESARFTVEQRRVAVSAGAMRAASQQLSYQIGDVAMGFAMGVNPMTIFAQQGGQVVQALTLMQGEAKGLLGFLGGPWGAVVMGAATIVGVLGGKLIESAHSSDAAADAQKRHADAAKATTRAIDDLTASLERNIQTERKRRLTEYGAAKSEYEKAKGARDKTKADIEELKALIARDQADIRAGRNSTDANRQFRINSAPGRIKDLQEQLGTQNKDVQHWAAQVLLGKVPLLQQQAAEGADKATAAQARFNREQDRLNDLFTAGKISGEAYTAQLADARKTLDAATASTDRASSSSGGLSGGHREAAAAAKAAAAAERELQASLDGLISRFDPTRSAAESYAKTLRDIAALESAGKLDPANDNEIKRRALNDYLQAQKDAQEESFRRLTTEVSPALARAMTTPLGDFASNKLPDMLESAGRAGGLAFRDSGLDAVRAITDALDLNLGHGAQRMLSLVVSGGAARSPFEQGASEFFAPIRDGLDDTLSKVFGRNSDFAKTMGSLTAAVSTGVMAGSLATDVFGGKGSKLGSAIGGALGGEVGKELLKGGLTSIFKPLGNLAGPIGGAIGGVLGSVVGGLFKKTKQASSTLSISDGQALALQATGRGSNEKAQANALAGSVASGLNQIADQLGAKLTGVASVSIGYRPGHKDPAYRVDTTGQGHLTGVQAFDTEQQAIQYAISDALKDGVLTGISQASRNILAAGKDLQTSIEKAVSIEQIPKLLQQRLDPIGFATDQVNEKYAKLIDTLKEGGASAEQFAEAQQLYNLEMADAKNSTASASQTLKDFIDSLKVGSNSPYSLRDQEGTAKAALQPFLDQIAAGQSIDQGKYQDAAQAFLDIERELYGSTDKFFAALDSVQAATTQAITAIDNAAPIVTPTTDPFAEATASATQQTANSTQAIAEILAQQSQLIAQQNQTLNSILTASSGRTSAGLRGF